MGEEVERAVDGFPIDPDTEALPVFANEGERLRFAFRLLEEQGDRIGDYIFAATRLAYSSPDFDRWVKLGELMGEILGKPLTLTYRACDRLAAERAGKAPRR